MSSVLVAMIFIITAVSIFLFAQMVPKSNPRPIADEMVLCALPLIPLVMIPFALLQPGGNKVRAEQRGAEHLGDSMQYLSDVMDRYNFTPDAKRYLLENISDAKILRPDTTDWGGYTSPGLRGARIQLSGKNDQVAVHELAHVWHLQFGKEENSALINALVRLHQERDQYPAAGAIAEHLVATYRSEQRALRHLHHQDGDWWNVHEIYAEFAHRTMGDISLMPPYLRDLYVPLFGGQNEK